MSLRWFKTSWSTSRWMILRSRFKGGIRISGLVYRPSVGHSHPPRPHLANGVEYIANSDLFAFNATNGHKLWRVSVAPSGLATTPTVADGFVMVAEGELEPTGSIGACAWAIRVGTDEPHQASTCCSRRHGLRRI